MTLIFIVSSSVPVAHIHAHETGYIERVACYEHLKNSTAIRVYGRATCVRYPLIKKTGIVFEKKVGDAVLKETLLPRFIAHEILSEKCYTEFEKNVIIDSECKAHRNIKDNLRSL